MQRAPHKWRAGCILPKNLACCLACSHPWKWIPARHSTFSVPIINSLPVFEGGIAFGRQVWKHKLRAKSCVSPCRCLLCMKAPSAMQTERERDGGPRQHTESAISCLWELAISGPGPPFALQHHLTTGIGFTLADGPAAHVLTLFVRAAPSSPPISLWIVSRAHTLSDLLYSESALLSMLSGSWETARSCWNTYHTASVEKTHLLIILINKNISIFKGIGTETFQILLLWPNQNENFNL